MEATDWQEQFCGTAPHARPLSGELYLNVCISRSWLYTPLLLLSVTSWEVSEVLHSPSYCLCPLWEQNICAHLLCPPEKRLMEDMPFVRPDQLVPWELGVCAWLVLMWYSLVRIYWRSGGHCASLQAPLLHLLSSGGAGALGMGEACCSLLLPVSFFIYCLDMWMELKRWNSKWESPLCSSKKNRSTAFVSLKGACIYFSFASQSLVGHSPAEKEVSVIHLTFSLRGGLGLMCLWVRRRNRCVLIAIHWLKQYFTCWAMSLDPFLC